GQPFAFARELPEIRPLALERLVEGLRFAVGLRPVGTREAVFKTVKFDHLGKVGRSPVVEGVVRQNFADRYASFFEGEERAFEEVGSGRPSLVGEDLGIGKAAVVIDSDMDVSEASTAAWAGAADKRL